MCVYVITIICMRMWMKCICIIGFCWGHRTFTQWHAALSTNYWMWKNNIKKKKLQSDLSSADTAGQLDRLEFLFTSCTVKYPCCRIPIWAHGKKAWNASNKQKSWNRFDFIYTCHPGLPRTPGVGHWSKKARRPETCHLVTSLMDFGGDFCWWLNHWNFLGSPTWEGP